MSCLLSVGACQLAPAADFVYTVRPGDHPWNIAERYLNDPSLGPALRERNRISDDRRLMPGTRLRIPQAWLKLETAQVRLLAVAGDATVQPDGAPDRAAVPGETLQAPSSLRTGPQGSATLLFADGSRVLVRRDSELRLQQVQTQALGAASLVRLQLLRGSLENEVTPAGGSGSRFEIDTPAATAAVRGTRFRVHLAPGDRGPLRTEVLEGAVNLANAVGQVTAQAVQGSVVTAREGPGRPVALLPAPDLQSLPERVERLPIDLPIAATPGPPDVRGAVGYRTQIAPDARFAVMVSDEVSPAARVRARDLEDGRYVLRLRAIDAQGLEGLSSERALVVHARPEPPLLIEPAPDALVTEARPGLRWTRADPRWSYRWQIANGADAAAFDAPVDEQVSPEAGAQAARDLPVGLYLWRVASIDAAKGQGPWGDAQSFRRMLPGPDVQLGPPKDGSLSLRWPAQPQIARYRLQVARDESFAAPEIDAWTETPQYVLQGLAPGLQHVRVQAIGADGYTGPWGGVQTFTVPTSPHWRALWLLIPFLVLL